MLMTSEICIMNRLAAVIAADSASSVSGTHDGRRIDRYFNGSNKVFQLSNHHPVGLMIYDASDILNVPWEIIIKAYRAFLGNKMFANLDDYAKSFFEFLDSRLTTYFPLKTQQDAVGDSLYKVFFGWIAPAIQDGQENGERSALVEAILSQKDEASADLKSSAFVDPAEFDSIIDANVERAVEAIRQVLGDASLADIGDFDRAARLILTEILVNGDDWLDTTGLVFVGFGEDQIFPAMSQYISCGVFSGKHLMKAKLREAVGEDMPAFLKGFAESSMADTFSTGVSVDVFGLLMQALSEELRDFVADVAARAGGTVEAIDGVDSLVQGVSEKIGDRVLKMALNRHQIPMINVLRHLPVEEMAGLAETLINLQSLKEKVTMPSERVGGPVDVAVITKHEGLVWIKRKHFFSAELNPRFSLRQASQSRQ
jgi:hypothetical protein